MPYRLTDKIRAPSRLTPEQAWAIAQANGALRPEFTKDLIYEAYRLCQLKGWDFANMFAQMMNETGNFTSALYRNKGNPGGIGKTGTDTSSGVDVSRTYANGLEAARAMAVHTNVYTEGPIDEDDVLYPYIYLDPRYQAALTAKDVEPGSRKLMAGTVKTLADWNVNGRWAELNNSKYGNNIIQRGNEVAPNIPNQEATGMPNPESLVTFVDAPVSKQRDGQGMNYGTRSIIGIVQHETQGSGSGPWYQQFFSCPNGERCSDAMVDYLIDVNGVIYRFNDPFTSNMIPWASGGGLAGPNRNNADGKAVDDAYGSLSGGVNRVYAAVEIVKAHGAAMNSKQIEAAARLTAYIAAKKGYPANDWKYPDVLGGKIPTSTDHSRISNGTNCVINADDRVKFENRATEILNDYYGNPGTGTGGGTPPTSGGGTTPPTGDAEVIVDGLDWGVAKRIWGTKFPAYVLTKGGPLSTLYIARGKAEGMWPSLVDQFNYDDGRRYFLFSNGWLALDPPGDAPNQKVRWVIDPPVKPAG